MKYYFRMVTCLTIILNMLVLSGCQDNPAKKVVVEKNDGSFNVDIIKPSKEPQNKELGSLQSKSKKVDVHECFYSTDNSVKFLFNVSKTITQSPMPVVEVSPYFVSTEDAERVAKVIFGEDVQFFESRSRRKDIIYSKDEIQQKLIRWSQYANKEAVQELYGRESAETVAIIQDFIEEYTKKYETAPEKSLNTLCEWEYKQDAYFWFPENEIAEKGTTFDNDAIKVEFDVGNIHYAYDVAVRQKEDFKMSRMSAYIYGGTSPDNIDERIYYATMCRTAKPSEEQLEAAKTRVEQILRDMDLGEWYIDNYYVESVDYGTAIEYSIHITAVPIFNGIPAIRCPQLKNLTSENVYASNYYLSDVSFVLSPSGKVLQFTLSSPIVIRNVINPNVETLDIDMLMERAKEHLQLSDRNAYSLSAEIIAGLEEATGEEIICVVDICEFQYGLSRVKAPNTDEVYYYIPSLLLYGNVDYYGTDSGTPLEISKLFGTEQLIPLLKINAIDGSIISLTN